MPLRISGVNIPDNKRIVIALTSVYGIGRNTSEELVKELNISPAVRTKELTPKEEQALREYIEKKLKVEGELKREVAANIKHHKDIGTYVGTRHMKNLPAHGQRTKTNSRTVRGNIRRTAGSGRKAAAGKT